MAQEAMDREAAARPTEAQELGDIAALLGGDAQSSCRPERARAAEAAAQAAATAARTSTSFAVSTLHEMAKAAAARVEQKPWAEPRLRVGPASPRTAAAADSLATDLHSALEEAVRAARGCPQGGGPLFRGALPVLALLAVGSFAELTSLHLT